MRAAAFETILPNGPIAGLPATLTQTPSRSLPFLTLALALPAAFAVLTPFAMIAAHASRDASLLTERADTAALLAGAMILWLAVFGWPLLTRARRCAVERTILIEDEAVIVRDHGLFGQTTWMQPLSAYRGIAHHVRASLSGTRHELLLIHTDPRRSLLLRTAPVISQSEIDQLGNLLGCREIAPQVFYRSVRWPVPRASLAVLGFGAVKA
jgi:hypothetical protein